MKTTTPDRLIVIALIVLLSGCKVQISVPEGGSVVSTSGHYECSAEEECTIDVSDVSFDETFVARPAEGYRFLGWKKGHHGLCGGGEEACRLSTTFFSQYEWLMTILQSDEVFYLIPIFSCEGDDEKCYAIRPSGPEETVFDWSRDRCEEEDIPDLPARAFRDASGNIQLLASHYHSRRMTGPNFQALERDCSVVMDSHFDPDPGEYNDKEWIAATYTTDGNKIHALVHNEYQGHTHQGMCPSQDYFSCWYNSLTYAWSDDMGRTYVHSEAPNHLVATVPYEYVPDKGPYGIFEGSNIINNPKDGFFYRLARLESLDKKRRGVLLMRTKFLEDPASWRCWDGDGFDVSFVNPYRNAGFDPAAHECALLAPNLIWGMNHSLTYNTLLDRFLLVSGAIGFDGANGLGKEGIFFSLSTDLIHWSPRKLILEAKQFFGRIDHGDRLVYASIIDHHDKSRNFERTDQDMYIYLTRWHEGTSNDRDLVRIPLNITVEEPSDLLPPEGYIDVLDCNHIVGWAIDTEVPDQPLEVAIYDVDANGAERLVARTVANMYRPDLAIGLGTSGMHGFRIATPSRFRDGFSHTVRVYAVNPDPRFPKRELKAFNPSTGETLQCAAG